MVRIPTVKLYYPNGAEVLYQGVNLCQKGLVSFFYTFEEGGEDKGNMVLQFNTEVPFSLELFRPGTFYRIKWGYTDELSYYRRVAVDKFASSFGSNGYTLKIDFVPEIIYKDKGEGHWATIEEAITKLDDIHVLYSYDSSSGSHVRLKVTAKGVGSSMFQDTYELKTLKSPGWKNPVAPTPPSLRYGAYGMLGNSSISPNDSIGVFENIMGATKEIYNDRVGTTLALVLGQGVPGHTLSARDNGYIVTIPNRSRVSLFTFSMGTLYNPNAIRSSRVISCSVAKPPSKSLVSAHDAVVVDPTKKEVGLVSTRVKETPFASYNPTGIVSDTAFTVIDDSLNLFIRPGSSSVGDSILADSLQTKKLRLQIKESKAFAKANKRNIIETRSPASYRDQFRVDMPALRQMEAEQYQDFLQRESLRIDMENLPYITNRVAFPQSKDQVISMLKGLELNDFYNALYATLVVEGIPGLTVGFNFNITGLGDLANGKYHASKVKHTIQGGKYTMSIQGGRIPHLYSRTVRDGVEKAEETFEAISEEELKVPEALDQIFSDTLFIQTYRKTLFYKRHKDDIDEQLESEREYLEASKDNLPIDKTTTTVEIQRNEALMRKLYFNQ